MRGAEEACRAQGIAFLPMVAESHGGWGEVAVATVDMIAWSLARQTGQPSPYRGPMARPLLPGSNEDGQQ